MKGTHWLVIGLSIVALGLAGCGKAKLQQTQEVEGTAIEMPKLQSAFANSSNVEANRLISQAAYGIRYSDYVKSLMALEQLNGMADITPEQKQIITNVMEQIKKVAGGGAAPAPAGQ